MGLLVNGVWRDQWYDTSKDGSYKRKESAFRNWVTADGEAGPTGEGGFVAESGRYHLYVSLACPWAHRTLIFRQLKGLAEHVSVSVVHPNMLEQGWTFGTDFDAAAGLPMGDALFENDYLHQIYTRAQPDFSGRVTVPVLWDKQQNTIVSNESAEIIRMFNSAFNALTGNADDYYPEHLRTDIDEVNERIYHNVNNGVYKAGFATTQAAYEAGVKPLFETLDELENRLETAGPYLLGDTQTEADWRLFTTLYRFDPVYVGHFKCNLKRIADYPALSAYMERLLAEPSVAETCHLGHIKQHYYYSHTTINPYRIVPLGPL